MVDFIICCPVFSLIFPIIHLCVCFVGIKLLALDAHGGRQVAVQLFSGLLWLAYFL